MANLPNGEYVPAGELIDTFNGHPNRIYTDKPPVEFQDQGKPTQWHGMAGSVPTANLYRALWKAQMNINAVAQDARNDFHKYGYVSAEAMVAGCRQAMHSAGLIFRRTGYTVDRSKTEYGMSGVVHSRFELIHAESGEVDFSETEWPIICDRGRPFDKALAGALTTALSYHLRDIMLIPRTEEDEGAMDRRDAHPPQGKRDEPRKPSAANSGVGAGVQGSTNRTSTPPTQPAAKPEPSPANREPQTQPPTEPAQGFSDPANPLGMFGPGGKPVDDKSFVGKEHLETLDRKIAEIQATGKNLTVFFGEIKKKYKIGKREDLTIKQYWEVLAELNKLAPPKSTPSPDAKISSAQLKTLLDTIEANRGKLPADWEKTICKELGVGSVADIKASDLGSVMDDLKGCLE